MIVSRKGRGRVNNGGGYNKFSNRHQDTKFEGGSRFEVLEKEDNEDRVFSHLCGYNGLITEKDQSAFHFKIKTKKNSKNPTTTNNHANVNSPAMQNPSEIKAKHSCFNENLVTPPTHIHAEILSHMHSKILVTSTNLLVPIVVPISLDPVKHTTIKFVSRQDFHSNPKEVSWVLSLPNLEHADPNILIKNQDKPPDEDLEIDANDKDDPNDESFKGEGGGSDSESDDSGTSLKDEDNIEPK